MKKANKHKVYEAYNEIMDWFDSHRSKDLSMEKYYLDLIENLIPPHGSILDAGCGTGEPMAKYFIEKGYSVTGIDASKNMIELCKQRFPDNRWLLQDMRTLNLTEQFNCVIAWHSLFHLPHDDQRHTLKLLTTFVQPQGLLIFTSGPEYSEEWGENGGYDLYHASLSSEEYQQILQDNHFKVLIHNVRDPNCGEATIWLSQKIEL